MARARTNVVDDDEEIARIRAAIREFAEEELREFADRSEEDGRFPSEVTHALGELGVLGLGFPEEYGGTGGSKLAFVVAVEEVYRVSPGIAASAFMSPLVASDILQAGNEQQKQRWLPSIFSGDVMAALALTEPDSGSDAASLRTKAERVDGRWRLNGRKMFITNGGLADVVLVLARVPDENGSGGISAFLVEADSQGFVVGDPLAKLGWRASETNSLFFDDCYLPEDALLGGIGSGFRLVMRGFDLERVALAAGAVGLAQGALDAATLYATERTQFGRPIGRFQAVGHALARARADVEASRQITYHAARNLEDEHHARLLASMAKLVATEMCQRVSRQAVQAHGGAGFMKEFSVERFYRDAMVMTIGGGTSEIQAELIARELGLKGE